MEVTDDVRAALKRIEQAIHDRASGIEASILGGKAVLVLLALTFAAGAVLGHMVR